MIDTKDEKILQALHNNARASTKALAQQVGFPRVTVHDRIQKLVKKGIITSFTVTLDYKKIGFSSEVFIFVSFLPNPEVSQRELAQRIAQFPGVFEVHIISGEYDLLLKARGESLETIGSLVIDKLRQLKGVGKTLTFACFDTVKEEK